jgi:transcription initiation factor TFIID TATA-box-binding protein
MSSSIVNIVATADLKQRLSLQDISMLPHTIFDQKIYGGRVAYLKTPEMHGKVTIFPSGKLISVGTKSAEESQQDLEDTVSCLSGAKLIETTPVEANVRNIVAVSTIKYSASLEEISELTCAIYEPEQFPGAILKLKDTNATYLIFQSGKIVISGTSSLSELEKAVKTIHLLIKSI